MEAATGGNVPTADSPPNLSAGPGPNEYHSPDFATDHIWDKPAMRPSDDVRLIEEFHNRFQIDDGQKGVRGQFKVEAVQPPQVRVRRIGNNQCVSEQLMTAQEYTFDEKIVKVWRRTFYVDEGLEEYYGVLTSTPAKVAGVAAGPSGAIFGSRVIAQGWAMHAAAGGAIAGELAAIDLVFLGAVTQVVAVGVGAFIGATGLMAKVHGSVREVDAGWAALFKFRTREEPIGDPQERWVAMGPPHPCPPERPRTGGDPPPPGTGVVPGGDMTPVGPSDAKEDRRGSMLPQSPRQVGMLACAVGGLVLLAAAPILAIRDGNSTGRTTVEGPGATVVAAAPQIAVKPIVATAGATTQYVVAVENAPAQEAMTYSWSGATCGTAQADGPRYVWDHREVSVQLRGGLGNRELGRSGDCTHSPADSTHGNPVIAVDISSESFTARCTIQGAGGGTGTPCDVKQVVANQQPPVAGQNTGIGVEQGGANVVESRDERNALPLVSAVTGMALLGSAGALWFTERRRRVEILRSDAAPDSDAATYDFGRGAGQESLDGVVVRAGSLNPPGPDSSGTVGPGGRDEEIIEALSDARSAGTLFEHGGSAGDTPTQSGSGGGQMR